MSLLKTWYEPDAAAAKYGIQKALLMEWVEEGLVRCERVAGKVVQVNIDDVKLEVEALVQDSGAS